METGKRKEKQEEVVVVPQEEENNRGTLKGLITDWGVDVSELCQEIMDADEI